MFWWALLYVLVIGGPGTGKTTLIKYLNKSLTSLGFKTYVIKDWARELIRINKIYGGPLPWIDRASFETEVIKKHLEDFRKALTHTPDVVLEDSGPLAAIAYCNVDGVSLDRELVNSVIHHIASVNIVFATEFSSAYSKDSERWEDMEYAMKIHKEIIKVHEAILKGRVLKLKHTRDPSQRGEYALKHVLRLLKRREAIIKGLQ